MDPEPAPAEADTTEWFGVTPHPLWLGLILAFGGALGAVDGQWGLAALFLAFSGAVLVGGSVKWWRSRRRQAVVADLA